MLVLVLWATQIQSSTHYRGLNCLQKLGDSDDIESIPNVLLPGQIPCVVWESGKFLDTKLPIRNFNGPGDDCKHGRYSPGFFHHGRWLSSCTVPWLSPLQLRASLAAKRFIFEGDSLTRQVFMRLIYHARGFSDIVEYPFHLDAMYAFNDTHDVFRIGSTWSASAIENPRFIAVFEWNPGMTPYPPFVADFSVRVLGFHYWINDQTFLQRINGFGNDRRNIHVSTPPTDQSYELKNRWINQTAHLPLKEMHDANVFERNEEDHMHFQCSFYLQVEAGKVKMPRTGDCRDMINLNLLMIIVNYSEVNLRLGSNGGQS